MEEEMPTASGHTNAILASRVTGTDVYSSAGEKIGHVEDIALSKTSNEILFAVVGFGGFLGIGEMFHALPWKALDYNEQREGYVTGLTKEQLQAAPTYRLDDLTKNDGAFASSKDYYAPYISPRH